ncbi:glycosyltransferase family 4 protein [Leptolinea tardivitalis]|uniref:Glycosyltransferase subfamily 4-like N-terminal domain-containing protein n=1 Tax=Leptolinea tardivitalis TaxID=229920 RepID=A0A0P6WYK9_9CHLR|nr:glycosyltransferase [Leptolinea tardivitalis]KPL71620.1 hypothetical protein ADM99_09040 [Leptolinea tardivitalis]GAP19946.1 glycosyltransferase [Leptolinea tardivitalis]
MSYDNRFPVTHVITGLGVGGAEMMLYKLLSVIDRKKYPPHVISLTDVGEIGKRISSLGISVKSLGMKPGRFGFSDVERLVNLVRDQKPAVVQTWMYHADLMGGWAAKKAGSHNIAWNIRNSTLDRKTSKASTMLIVRLCALLSHSIPERIIVCSQAAADIHQKIGYNPRKMQVIPNGFDLSTFKPDQTIGQILRKQLGLNPSVPVVGLAARYDEQKDHPTFISSAGIILQSIPETHFLLCGDGITSENSQIVQQIKNTGHEGHFHLLGRQTKMQEFHLACNIAVSSSAYGESFSNVLGEAMACGIPCVSTRVGGVEEVLGNTGRIVPPHDPESLANAVIEILQLPEQVRNEMGLAGRKRIVENFDINAIARSYMQMWGELSAANE